MDEYIWHLQQSPLFAGIKTDDMKKLLACLSGGLRKFEKNEIIFLAGDPVGSIGVILDGRIQIQGEDFFGSRSIITEFGRGMVFAEAFACGHVEKFPVTVMAAENSAVFFINYKKMMSLCSGNCGFHQRLIQNLVEILARKSVLQNEKLEILSKRSTREKILAYLSIIAKRACSSRIAIPFSRQELADYLSVDRSAMSSELGKMKDEGIIDFHKNEFTILSKRADDFE